MTVAAVVVVCYVIITTCYERCTLGKFCNSTLAAIRKCCSFVVHCKFPHNVENQSKAIIEKGGN